MTIRLIAATSTLLLVSGCGNVTKSANEGSTATTTQSGGVASIGRTYDADWAREPCKSFPIAAAAKASGMAIKTAEVGNVVTQDSITNGSCGYSDGGTAHFRVALHIDTSGKQTIASQVAQMAARPEDVGAMEPVPVASGKAFWLPTLQEVIYYPDDQRSVIVVPPGANVFDPSKSSADAKTKGLAIALAAAG